MHHLFILQYPKFNQFMSNFKVIYFSEAESEIVPMEVVLILHHLTLILILINPITYFLQFFAILVFYYINVVIVLGIYKEGDCTHVLRTYFHSFLLLKAIT